MTKLLILKVSTL